MDGKGVGGWVGILVGWNKKKWVSAVFDSKDT